MTQHSKFSEAALEQAIIELLGQEGYPYVKGDTITREPGQVLLHADLRAFLAKQYAADGITAGEIDAVIRQLEAYPAADLYESNKAIMKLVSDGFLLKRERTLTPSPSPRGRGESTLRALLPPGEAEIRNIAQASKSGQRSRQMARFPSSKRRQITNRDKNHDTLSRFGVMQAAHRLIATFANAQGKRPIPATSH